MTLPISIIIPAFNEARSLPKLLASIQNQTVKPLEIIIGDAHSTDETQSIARSFGCIIAEEDKKPGNGPAKGRNAGAQKAKGDILLFLDADTRLPSDFLEKAFSEFVEKDLSSATCGIYAYPHTFWNYFGTWIMNGYFRSMQYVKPHAAGYCIFIRKVIHENINGFDQSLFLAEDHDYVQRASRIGKFRFLTSVKLYVSTRRFREEGFWKTFSKYFYSEIQTLLGLKMRKGFFAFTFGEHTEE